MKTLHFVSLNNCFVRIHVVVRLTHAYRDFVADNDYAIFIQILGLFKRQRLKKVFLTFTCCSRQIIHYLMNRYNRTGYVRVPPRPGRTRVTSLRPYHVNALTHQRNRFKWQPLLLVFTGLMHKR